MKQELQGIFLENTKLPIVSINIKGEVTLWSKGAEKLFGYSREEVINTQKNILTKDNENELPLVLQGCTEQGNFIYKLQQEHKKGYPINVQISSTPIKENGELTGILAVIQSSSSIKKSIMLNSSEAQKETKRTFKVIRNTILSHLTKSKMTINQISNGTSINWKTVEKHLTYLIGKKLVEEVFSSEYVRIFELTEKGKEYITTLQKETLNDYFKVE